MRISALSQQFLRFFVARGHSPRSAETYDISISSYLASLRDQGFDDDIRSFTPETVEAFATSLQERGLKASTINLRLAALHSLGQFGVKTKDARGKYILEENPLTRVYRPKRQRPKEKYLSLAEVRALLAAPCSAPERLVIDLLVDTGLRASEIADANVEHLRLDGERVVLSVRVKGGRHREITLGPEAAARLLESLKFREAQPADPLLVSARGDRFSRTSLSEVVCRVARRAGITRFPVRAHVLRHTVATLASATGADVPTIAAMLNHSDIHTVQRYVHRQDAVDAAREAVRRALGASSIEPNARPSP
jgi:site-specific recombinase XerD